MKETIKNIHAKAVTLKTQNQIDYLRVDIRGLKDADILQIPFNTLADLKIKKFLQDMKVAHSE